MFTGLVEEIGSVTGVRKSSGYQLLQIQADRVLEGASVGDSICIDGACQTVTRLEGNRFSVEVLAVTLEKTTLGTFRCGRRVNLERAVTPSTRLGGHFVQGHVDATGSVVAISRNQKNVFLTIELHSGPANYCAREGSIAIDGVSLTIAELCGTQVTVNLIPLTLERTVLSERRIGDRVNVEVDIIGRYLARMLEIERRRNHDRSTPSAGRVHRLSPPGGTRDRPL